MTQMLRNTEPTTSVSSALAVSDPQNYYEELLLLSSTGLAGRLRPPLHNTYAVHCHRYAKNERPVLDI